MVSDGKIVSSFCSFTPLHVRAIEKRCVKQSRMRVSVGRATPLIFLFHFTPTSYFTLHRVFSLRSYPLQQKNIKTVIKRFDKSLTRSPFRVETKLSCFNASAVNVANNNIRIAEYQSTFFVGIISKVFLRSLKYYFSWRLSIFFLYLSYTRLAKM